MNNGTASKIKSSLLQGTLSSSGPVRKMGEHILHGLHSLQDPVLSCGLLIWGSFDLEELRIKVINKGNLWAGCWICASQHPVMKPSAVGGEARKSLSAQGYKQQF